jgi:hypothetical protein
VRPHCVFLARFVNDPDRGFTTRAVEIQKRLPKGCFDWAGNIEPTTPWRTEIREFRPRPLVLTKVVSAELNSTTTTRTRVGAEVHDVFSILSLVTELKPIDPLACRHHPDRNHRAALDTDISGEPNAGFVAGMSRA